MSVRARERELEQKGVSGEVKREANVYSWDSYSACLFPYLRKYRGFL